MQVRQSPKRAVEPSQTPTPARIPTQLAALFSTWLLGALTLMLVARFVYRSVRTAARAQAVRCFAPRSCALV